MLAVLFRRAPAGPGLGHPHPSRPGAGRVAGVRRRQGLPSSIGRMERRRGWSSSLLPFVVPIVLASGWARVIAQEPAPVAVPAPRPTRLCYDLPAYELSQRLRQQPDLDLDALMKGFVARVQQRVGKDATVRHTGGTVFEVEATGDAARVEAVRARVEVVGLLEMRVIADAEFFDPHAGVRFDLAAEQKRLQEWLAAGGRARVLADWRRIDEFNASKEEGPLAFGHLRWCAHRVRPQVENRERWQASFARDTQEHGGVSPMGPATVAVFGDADWNGGVVAAGGPKVLLEYVAVNTKERCFTNEHFDPDKVQIVESTDGRPALSYMLRPEYADEYGDWSERYVRKHVAVLLDGEVRSAPWFVTRLPGIGMVTGLDKAAAESVAASLRSGEIPFAPVLLRQEAVRGR